MDDPIVIVEGLHKRFGHTQALRGLDLTARKGTILGILGPNGAGKTTAIRVLATIAVPTAGRASIAGFDVVRQADQVRRRIGLAGQHAALDEGLTGRDNLRLFGRLSHLGRRAARARADELLERFGLMAAADRKVNTYSGGMRRRIDLITSLLVAPEVLFLDEPTTGLDPRSKGEIWTAVRSLVADGTTVLLTTQYLEEADQLADDIVVVDHGQAIATGAPDELKARIGNRIHVVPAEPADLASALRILHELTGASPVAEEGGISVPVPETGITLPDAVRALDRQGVRLADIALRRPSLDEVFLRLTETPEEIAR